MPDKDHSSHSGQSKGGEHSGGNFKNDPERAREAGKKGGEHSHGGTHQQSSGTHERGGTHQQHVEAGKQSHKNK